MKKLLFGFLALLAFHVGAQDIWTPGYVWDNASNSGRDVWYGPGNKVTTNGAMARSANIINAVNGVSVTETGAVALRDGRKANLTATRLATAAEAAAPIGRFLAKVATPLVVGVAVYDLAKELGFTLGRDTSGQLTTTKNDSSLCTVAPCYEYYAGSTWFRSYSAAAVDWANRASAAPSSWNYTIQNSYHAGYVYNATRKSDGATQYGLVSNLTWRSASVQTAAEIAATQQELVDAIAAKSGWPSTSALARTVSDAVKSGESMSVSPGSITGPSPALTPLVPYVQTTSYPKEVDQTSTTVAQGNPFNLVDGAPAVTGTSDGTRSVSPGNTTSTGQLTTGQPAPVPAPITVPSRTTSTSTYDQSKNTTSTTSTTTTEPHTKTTTVTGTTSISNTPTASTATTTVTNVTNVTNNTTNVTNTTTTTGSPESGPPPSEDPCADNPDRIGCLKLGDTPQAEKLTDKVNVVTVTAAAFASSSACPAPLGFDVIGHHYAFSYQGMCDRLAMLKFLFLMMGGIVAAYILADSFKVT